MSDCISLIDSHVDKAKLGQWVNVSQMTNVIHTESIDIVSAASGHLDIEPFAVTDVDCRIVGAIVYHCCDTGPIHSYDCDVICHLFQSGADTIVKLDCWELNPKQTPNDTDICWNRDPCARLDELRCCLMQRKDGMKTSWSFRDSSGSTSYLSEKALMMLIGEAEAECDALSCRNTRCLTYRCNNGYC